jgi:hypothetical protein
MDDTIIEEKLNSLTPTSVWSFAKQDTNFENVFKATCIFDSIPDISSVNVEQYFNTHSLPDGYNCNHRMLSSAQLFGLLTKNSSTYSKEAVTPVFRELKNYPIGSDEFNSIKSEQLLKIKIGAIIDRSDNKNNHQILPIFFIFDVLYKLHELGIEDISMDQLYTYVMTCSRYEEVTMCVECLKQDPPSSELTQTFASNCRMWTLITNNSKLFKVSNSRVSINPNYIDFFHNHFYMNKKNVIDSVLNSILNYPDAYKAALTTVQGFNIDLTDDSPKEYIERRILKNDFENLPLQQVFYGAPGTGKSHEIKLLTNGCSVVRTTFHPDSDYSTFVGAYKPTMTEVDCQVVPVVINNGISLNQNNGTYTEKRISYQFVKQAFLKAYLGAWKKYSEWNNVTISTPINQNQDLSFNVGTVKYTISDIDDKRIVLNKESLIIKKITVGNKWSDLWSTGNFVIPTGLQSGTSIPQAICKWIYENDQTLGENDFETGWSSLVNKLKDGVVEASKGDNAQTYYLSAINDTDDSIVVSHDMRKTKELLRTYFNNNSNDNNNLVMKLVTILKNCSKNDFEEAWDKLRKNYKNDSSLFSTTNSSDGCEPQFLIIEEINRGNCAQIFGDLFQLLDRANNGFSEYPIEADTDLQKEIEKAFSEDYKLNKDIQIEGAIKDYISNYNATLSEDVQKGRVLLFPPNLFIWATMNTSDQSLFPIDSAFKRRWDWKYVKITEGKDENGQKLNWSIDVQLDDSGTKLSWWAFVEKINEIIASMTSSADKQLGYFFCKAKNGVIDKNAFVSKVIFYLWNDVFKDYGFEDTTLFRYKNSDGEEKDLTYPDFYDIEGVEVNSERLSDFLKKVMNWKKNNNNN